MNLPGVEMENDPEDNPCFACGPRNPVGLRMRFFDDGEVVRSELVLDDRYSGWKSHVIQGILYVAMDDLIFWAAYARFGRMGTSVGDPRVSYPAPIRTNEPFVVECRRGPDDVFEATCVQRGVVGARMEWRMRPWTREEFAQALVDPRTPRAVREDAQREAS